MVHTLMLTNKEAQKLIEEGEVQIDGIIITKNCELNEISEIRIKGKIERVRKEFVYLLFNKPAGFESTLNKKIEKNISPFFDNYSGLAIAGRLDKQSKGLLLLSNDGKWIENLCNPKFEKEKEYIVSLDKPISDEFIASFVNGVEIDGFTTKKCFCEKIDSNTIRIILTEGKNRQIRKMCKVLGFNVISLLRIRISEFHLGNIKEGNTEITKI
ncbi:MAG: pseudouridine synthase [Bacteroidota bacterium]|nr:pseudouridine synthase [Bacteroidota bacterium]